MHPALQFTKNACFTKLNTQPQRVSSITNFYGISDASLISKNQFCHKKVLQFLHYRITTIFYLKNLAFYMQFLTLEFKAQKLRLPYEQGDGESHLKIDGPGINSDIIM